MTISTFKKELKTCPERNSNEADVVIKDLLERIPIFKKKLES